MNRLTKRHNTGVSWNGNPDHSTQVRYRELLDRLAAYEDTGLTPEEVAELAKAKADGRLVVLPCKIGTKVYFISQDCEMCRSLQKDEPCLFGDCPYRGITETIFTYGAIGQFGKTVFFTREEAEAALRKE